MGLKIDGNDNVILYGALDTPIDIDPSNNNTVIINPTGTYGCLLFAKFNNNGAYKYSKFITGSEDNYMNDFHITKNNKFFFYASFNDSAALAPAGIPSIGECSVYGKKIIVQMDSMFNAFYYDEISNSYDSSSYFQYILSGTQNNIYLCGSYSGRFDADFSSGVYYLENPNVNPPDHIHSGLISKYEFPSNLRLQGLRQPQADFIAEKAVVEKQENDIGFSIAANTLSPPAIFLFENTLKNPGCLLRVFNTAGKLIYQKTHALEKTKIQLNLTPGIYLVQICSGSEIMTSGKLVAY